MTSNAGSACAGAVLECGTALRLSGEFTIDSCEIFQQDASKSAKYRFVLSTTAVLNRVKTPIFPSLCRG
jgi:hypothetical protein